MVKRVQILEKNLDKSVCSAICWFGDTLNFSEPGLSFVDIVFIYGLYNHSVSLYRI